MQEFRFSLIVEPSTSFSTLLKLTAESEAFSDAKLAVRHGRIVLDFIRISESRSVAINSALDDAKHARIDIESIDAVSTS